MSIAVAFAADKESPKFEMRPAASYAAHQTNAKVTIGAQAYQSDEEAKPAFGKNNPYKYGILPILIVMQNGSDQTIRVENMKVEYVAPDRSRAVAIPARDVRYVQGADRPKVLVGPTGPRVKKSKNPLDSWEIEGRAFAAKMLPPGQSAGGFFYFQTGYQHNSTLYITGLSEASSGKELFYFEIPLQNALK
ncbi:MAG: hypothetical protein M1436_09450 [Acidobacteria bacterium]|nr:hypothetical protein [Acidobacteriota bacterium]